MRNNFEHIDERIERWWAESPARNYVDNTIGRKNAIIGVGDIDTFRWFDPESGEIRFWGVGLNLVALIDEAERLLKRGKIL